MDDPAHDAASSAAPAAATPTAALSPAVGSPSGAEPSSGAERQVQAAVDRLDELDTLDIRDHVGVYEDVHESLRAALSDQTDQAESRD